MLVSDYTSQKVRPTFSLHDIVELVYTRKLTLHEGQHHFLVVVWQDKFLEGVQIPLNILDFVDVKMYCIAPVSFNASSMLSIR